MTAFRGRGLHGQVVNALGTRIMRGQLTPGEQLDPDALANEFDVSRTVMREALKVLTAKGLVDARPKLGTFVTDRAKWQLLDVDIMNWRTQDEPDARLVVELDEVRVIIEPAAAAMAAANRTPQQMAAITAAFDALVDSYRRNDESDHIAADVAYHLAILGASGNELLERFEVVLEPALQARHRLALRNRSTHDFIESHRAVYDAIAAGDPQAARERMTMLMQRSAEDIASIFTS